MGLFDDDFKTPEPKRVRVMIGMSKSAVIEVLGKPDDKMSSETSRGTRESWFYNRGKVSAVFFEDGAVSSINRR